MAPSEQYLTRSSATAARTIGDETIIMSTVDSTIFMLNPTGTVIWKNADGHTPLSRIVKYMVCAEFDVPIEQAAADAQSFVDEMATHGILVVSNQPIPPAPEVP
jgi:hypothetical protein